MSYKIKKNKINLANLPTPIEKTDFQIKGHNIYIKRDDLTGAELSGNKVRKLEYVIADAKDKNSDILITCGGIQSNHARATAVAAVRTGLKAELFLSTDIPIKNEGNVLLDRLFGAKITPVKSEDFKNIDRIMDKVKEDYAQKGLKAYPIPVGASNRIGNLGYLNAFNEILEYEEKTGIVFDTIVTTIGSGGTYSGLWLGNHLNKSGKKIVGINVAENAEHFKKVITDISNQTLEDLGEEQIVKAENITVIDGFVGRGYALSTQDEINFIKETTIRTGILFDPVYTGKAFKGLHDTLMKSPELISSMENSNILFIHTGGLYSVFSRADELTD